METVDKTVEAQPHPGIENLTPWQPGQSGNPSGRPKGQRNYTTIFHEALVKIGESQDMTPDEVEDMLMRSGLTRALKGDYRFFKDIMDRVHGSPNKDPEGGGNTINIFSLTQVLQAAKDVTKAKELPQEA